jgi:hypothetical protein
MSADAVVSYLINVFGRQPHLRLGSHASPFNLPTDWVAKTVAEICCRAEALKCPAPPAVERIH